MPNIWTINAVTGGSTKSDLVGCHIKENDLGTAYIFTDTNPNVVLSTTETTSLPTPPFVFPNFGLDGYDWRVTVDTLTGGPSGNRAEGDWSNNAPDPVAAEDGTYTAQAGSGAAAEDDREAAASA